MPIFLGYAPVGAAFGVLARGLGFSAIQATVCSATALAGAGQFIALELIKGGANVAATLIATGVVNLRYLLFGTTLSPATRSMKPLGKAWIAYTLTDETFAINVADHRQGKATPASMAGVGLIAWCGWVAGTVLGFAGAAWIGDPRTWGVDFAMPAMFSALFVALAENRRHIVAGIAAGVVVLALPLLREIGVPMDSSWSIIIASLSVSGLATVVFRDN